MEKLLRFRFAHTICTLVLSLVSQRIGNISKGETRKLTLLKCSGFANCMNGRKKQKIHLSFLKRYVLIWVHLKYLSSRQRALLSHFPVWWSVQSGRMDLYARM